MLSPAKLNLFLAVTGRRPSDGFHDLLSVVAQLDWGDDLSVEAARPEAPTRLVCDDPAVPPGPENLVLRAALAAGAGHGRLFRLKKRIPMGAGLGGGSSNAAAALRLLGSPDPDIAASLGSDCPLFLRSEAVVMRGRGEAISALPAGARRRIAGRRVVVMKPPFGIATPWAYRQMAAGEPRFYLHPEQAEARLAAWLADEGQPLERLLYNNLEAPAFAKYPALPSLLERLRERFGVATRMTGSGSACFALLPAADPELEEALAGAAQAAWGPHFLSVACTLAA